MPAERTNLLSLRPGRERAWRTHPDLEHDLGDSPSSNRNALTEGRWRYICKALGGEKTAFDMQSDAAESRNLAATVSRGDELRRGRDRLVRHFEEGGEPYLRQVHLAPRAEGRLHPPW